MQKVCHYIFSKTANRPRIFNELRTASAKKAQTCASQGRTEEEALANLREALELHFEPPQATRPPKVRTIEVEVGAA